MTSKSPAASLPDKSLKDLTVVELKDLCKERGIKGFAHKTKARLLEMLEAAASGTPAKPAADQPAAAAPSQARSSKSAPKKKPKATKTTPAQENGGENGGQQGDLTSLTIVQLKQFCKDRGIKGFARKSKQQLLELINSTISTESSNNQPEIDEEERQDPDDLNMENIPMDGSDSEDSDQLSAEDVDANQIDQEESAEELSSGELDAANEDFEDQFDGDAEETMVEVSDSLILEVLDRFDRIEALLRRIAENYRPPAKS